MRRPSPGPQPSCCPSSNKARWHLRLCLHCAPPEDPWATCPRWAVWAPCSAVSVAGCSGGWASPWLCPARGAESVFSGACYTPACRDCGMSRQISVILATLCRARNKAAYGQRWPVWDLQQPQRLGGLRSCCTPVAHSWHGTWPVGKLWITQWQEPSHPLSLSLLESMPGGFSYPFLFHFLVQRSVERLGSFSPISEANWPSPVGFHFSQMTTWPCLLSSSHRKMPGILSTRFGIIVVF